VDENSISTLLVSFEKLLNNLSTVDYGITKTEI